MPELPEVETVCKSLAATIIGKKIKGVEVFWPKIVKLPDVEQFCQLLIGQTVQQLERRGKFLLFYFDTNVMVSHLRMEGKYSIVSSDEPYDKHEHIVFHFEDGTDLRYKDVRKFGTMHLFAIGKEFTEMPLSGLGPEPFAAEYTIAYLQQALLKSKRMIKSTLLDQTIVTGLGNIYVDETLFRAGVHPERLCTTLSADEIEAIYHESKATLSEAIEAGGSTIRSYINSLGEIGLFQLQLKAYGRAGMSCLTCGTMMSKLKVGGRGTVVCSACQK